MVRTFLVRGMLAGIVAGLLSFAFLKVYGEPQVDRAVAFETQQDEARSRCECSACHFVLRGSRVPLELHIDREEGLALDPTGSNTVARPRRTPTGQDSALG